MKTPPIRIIADISYGTGYNNATRGLVQALEVLGLGPEQVRVIGGVASTNTYYDDATDRFTEYIFCPAWPGEDKISITHLNPSLAGLFCSPLNGRYNIAYVSWETDRLPRIVAQINGQRHSATEDLNRFDEVWVPARFLVEVLQRSGVTKPIFVVPHVLQRELLDWPGPLRDGADARFLFYFIGSWNARKNPQQLLRTYLSLGWTRLDPVMLTLRVSPPTRDLADIEAHGFVASGEIKALLAAMPDSDTSAAFGLLTAPRRYSDIVDQHRNSHCFVTLSNGEGFGLPAVEALAYGNTVIGGGPWLDDIQQRIVEVGGCSAADVDAVLRRVPYTAGPITPMAECRGYELDHKWWVPDVAAAAAEMRSAYAARGSSMMMVGETLDDADAVRARVAHATCKAFSPETVAEIVRQRLEHAVEVTSKVW